MSGNIIEVKELTFIYPGSDKPALNRISLSVARGEFIGITGPAGAGKSTLSYCLNGIIPHYQAGRMAGGVFIEGRSLTDIPGDRLARTIGSVLQDPEAQIVALTVEEEVAFGMENLGFPRELMMQRIDQALKMADIEDIRFSSTAALSGGQKQRVAIASVLAMMPDILILDEPASELDPVGTQDLFNILTELNKQFGITILLIEQRIDQLAGCLDRLLVLDKGELIADGRPEEVLASEHVVSLGVKIPQVTEFALLFSEMKKVPITFEQGMDFVQKVIGGGRL